MPYTIGSNVQMACEFQHDGVDTDPTGITFKLYINGVITLNYVYGVDANLVKLSTGNYYVDYAVATAGYYQWVMAGTGSVIARRWDSFDVDPDPVLGAP